MKDAEILLRALERIADSEPRPKRNGNYLAFDIEALQRTARLAVLAYHQSEPESEDERARRTIPV